MKDVNRRRGGRTRRLALAVSMAALAAGLVAGAASGAPPPSISTQGVVVFGMASQASTDGTYRMNPNGTGFQRIATIWYPNDVSRGQVPVTVLVNSGQDVYALRADGSGAPVPLLVSSEIETQLRFSPDGTRIAYGTVTVGSPNVYTITVVDVLRDGANDVVGIANPQVVWTSSGIAGPYQTRGLDFSRDGSTIVFAASNSGGAFDLYAVSLVDGGVEQLTNTPEIEEYPRWSPVDDRIAYQQRASAGTAVGSVLTLDFATRAIKTVVAGGSNLGATMPCWSPDATRLLAIVRGYKKPIDLWQFPSTGGKGVNVTGGIDYAPNMPCWGW